MIRRLIAAAVTGALASAALGACASDTLATQLEDAGPSPLFVPVVGGEKPFSWFQRDDGAVVLTVSARGPLGARTAVLSTAPSGDLCDAMPSTYDRCTAFGRNAASFAFEEQGAVVVRRGATLVTWPDLVLEGPDEEGFDLHAEVVELVRITRRAPALDAQEFADEVEYVD